MNQQDWKEWQKKTSFHPLSDWDKVMEDPTVILPANGSFYIIANNLDEIKNFMWRLTNTGRWETVNVLSRPNDDVNLKDNYEEYYDDEVFPDPISKIKNPKTISYNQYYDPNERLQVHLSYTAHELYELNFNKDFLKDLTFPCLVQYSAESGFDRCGNTEMNHCQILNLTGCPLRDGPVKVHLRWL